MLTVKTVLPNFIKASLFLTTFALSLSASAEQIEGMNKEAQEMTHSAKESMTEMKSEGTETIGDLKDMTQETAEEVTEESEASKETMHDMVAK